MFEREPNIDLVFRNGLREMEVLPPAEVWDNIPPMPVPVRRSKLFLSVAAGLAALISLTLMAAWLTRITGRQPVTELAITDSGDGAVIRRIDDAASGTALASRSVARMPDVTSTISTDGNVPSALTVENGGSSLSSSSDEVTADVAGEVPVNGIPEARDEINIIAQGSMTIPPAILSPDKKEVPGDAGPRFLLGASLLPSMGFSASGPDARLADLMSGEKTRPVYSTGVSFGFQLSHRLTIHSGIGYSSMGQVISGIDVFAGLSDFYSAKGNYLYSVETSSGLILAGNTDLYLADSKDRVGSHIPQGMADPSKYPLTMIGTDIHQVFRYLELPLVVRYKVVDRTVDLNLSGGMFYGFLVDNYAYTRTGTGTVAVGHTADVNPYSLSSQLGVGMEYNLSNNISFNLEPVFRYYVTPVSQLSESLYKPYSFGLFSGFFFKF